MRRPENVARGRRKETPAQPAERASRRAIEARISSGVQMLAIGVPVDPLVWKRSKRRPRRESRRNASGLARIGSFDRSGNSSSRPSAAAIFSLFVQVYRDYGGFAP